MTNSSKLPSKFSSLLKCRCPRCRQGDIFKSKSTDLKNFRQMHTHCPKCNLRYEYEVGFFWSAMYIAYSINVAMSVILGVLVYFFLNNPNEWVYISIIVAGIILSMPFTFRYGRVILLYIFAPEEELKNVDSSTPYSNPNLN